MPEEFDLPIDGEYEPNNVDDPKPKKKRGRAPTRKAATRRATPRRKVTRRVVEEEVFETPQQRPRISIETATHVPKRVNMYRRLSLTFFGATVVVIGIIAFFTFQRATITISQEALPVAATLAVDIVDTANTTSTAPLSSNTFSGMIVSVTTSTSRSFAPTATSAKLGKSQGTVTIFNTGKAAQSLVATTRFLSASGVLFRLSKSTAVPAGAHVDAQIVADQPGAQGDVPAGTFIIPGLSAANQKLIYGQTSVPTTGGSSMVGVVSQQDIDQAQEAVRKDLFDIGQQVLASVQIPDVDAVLHTPVSIQATSSAKSGDATSAFTVTAQGTMAFVAYPKDAVYAAADSEVQNHVPTPYHKVVFTSDAPTVSLQSISPETKSAKLQLYREGRAVLDVHSNAFQSTQFLGRTKQEIIDSLTSIQGVTHIAISFFPFWVDHAPKVPSRIQVSIQDPQ